MKKKITILARDAGFGGETREIISLTEKLIDLYDVEILFLNSINEDIVIDPKIKVTIKNPNILESIKFYTELLNNSDVVIATDFCFNKYVVKYSKGKKILWMHKEESAEHQNKMLLKYDYIVVPNKFLKEYYMPYNANTVIINDAITIPEFDLSCNGKNIIFIGKLDKSKNIDLLLDVFSDVKRRVDTNLVLIGAGSERKNLEMLVKERQLSDVYFKGLLNKNEVRQELMDGAVYVTCSESDNSSLSILEAMSYGLPVVAFNEVLEYSSYIIDDINGYLIDNKDICEMKEKIIELLTDDVKRLEFSNCAREKVLEFDINSIKREWIKIF